MSLSTLYIITRYYFSFNIKNRVVQCNKEKIRILTWCGDINASCSKDSKQMELHIAQWANLRWKVIWFQNIRRISSWGFLIKINMTCILNYSYFYHTIASWPLASLIQMMSVRMTVIMGSCWLKIPTSFSAEAVIFLYFIRMTFYSWWPTGYEKKPRFLDMKPDSLFFFQYYCWTIEF